MHRQNAVPFLSQQPRARAQGKQEGLFSTCQARGNMWGGKRKSEGLSHRTALVKSLFEQLPSTSRIAAALKKLLPFFLECLGADAGESGGILFFSVCRQEADTLSSRKRPSKPTGRGVPSFGVGRSSINSCCPSGTWTSSMSSPSSSDSYSMFVGLENLDEKRVHDLIPMLFPAGTNARPALWKCEVWQPPPRSAHTPTPIFLYVLFFVDTNSTTLRPSYMLPDSDREIEDRDTGGRSLTYTYVTSLRSGYPKQLVESSELPDVWSPSLVKLSKIDDSSNSGCP